MAEPRKEDGSTTQSLQRNYTPGGPDGWSRFLALVWEPNQILIQSESHGGEARSTPACFYPEPLVFVSAPLEAGTVWDSRSSCDDPGDDRGSARRTGEVVEHVDVVVEGEPIMAIVIDEELLRIRSDGSVRTESSRLWFSPEHALILKSEIDVSDQQEGDFTISSVLVSLTPGELPFG